MNTDGICNAKCVEKKRKKRSSQKNSHFFLLTSIQNFWFLKVYKKSNLRVKNFKTLPGDRSLEPKRLFCKAVR